VIELIGFDADDTLWHNEIYYRQAQDELRAILSPYQQPGRIDDHLYQTEMKNLDHFGYGTKGFILSMIETAIELSQGCIPSSEIVKIINLGKQMLQADVVLLDHVQDAVADLAGTYPLVLITKGDLLDQQRKLGGSGLTAYFQQVEIVSEKSPDLYLNLLQNLDVAPICFLMVGNSLRSDIQPVLDIGGQAVFVPYQITWQHEIAEEADWSGEPGCHQLEHLGQLPDLVAQLNS